MKHGNNYKFNLIKENLEYAIKSRGETKNSFSKKTGITRTTLYNILGEKVDNIQIQTIEKIAAFLGTSRSIVESYSVEFIEKKSQLMSVDGNQNPICVPVLKGCEYSPFKHSAIGELVSLVPIVPYFGTENNLLGIVVDVHVNGDYKDGTLLIVERYKIDALADIVYLDKKDLIQVRGADYNLRQGEILIGCVRGIRVNYLAHS
ncbi:helix-turn-helix domain-containing protein [Vibrio marisflavi]|uniref:HTH cro/C1-type domain-containing protein n=1 Tax=Vibrio marisflavi CECT 7928 TaxID=634439 RepID=A0ABN8E8T7_9VIBR|nr:helix-turn-helix transcriptional regulator [Vibrio marisflavi]CAH0542973.1 hypothetical protein VMF7928_04340 [Vibrio marisflavi CECT 7928]